MKNIGGTSRFVGFLDECGDHSMSVIDKDFPLFVLSTVVMERSVYVEHLIPLLGRMKLRYWNHEGVNLHSRDIRKASGAFSFLMVESKRMTFVQEVTELVAETPFVLFVTAIHKAEHCNRHGTDAKNPYDLALEYTMDRILHYLKSEGECELPLVAEARGRREDESLERVFFRIQAEGTDETPADGFKSLKSTLVFRSKRDNIAGIQVADLCAYPCARRILKPDQPNRAFDAVHGHLYERDCVSGWRVFP